MWVSGIDDIFPDGAIGSMSNCISSDRTKCLTMVKGNQIMIDHANSHPGAMAVSPTFNSVDEMSVLFSSLPQAVRTAFRNRISSIGVDPSFLDTDRPLKQILTYVLYRIMPANKAEGLAMAGKNWIRDEWGGL
jgi:hypothetical protein